VAPGGLIRKIVTQYAFLGVGSKILDHPSSVVVQDSGGNVKASTTYSYDQTTPTPTTNTPNHIAISVGRGNLTTMSTQASGSVTLSRKFTYYDTGKMNTASDAGTTSNGGPNSTTYNYADATSTCGNTFPTSVSEPLSLSQSFTWDCVGGVMKTATDENSKVSTVYYSGSNFGKSADPNFWRPYATTDQLGTANPTTLSYPSATAAESTMLFNNPNSVVDHRAKVDGFGRPIINQTKQGPNATNYDSVETDYDFAGRPSKSTLPYSATVDSTCSGTCPGISTTYEALNRPWTVTDGGAGTTTYTYSQNDIYQEITPPPPGESSKKKQLEYDSIGRVTSVCEITGSTGSGTCGQTVNKTGFWTKYSYDLLGNMTGVTQNAQAVSSSQQTRTYTFDMLGRLTSELNPETGSTAITYVYDSWDSSCGTYTSAGDLVEKKDAMNNVTCLKYDGRHRVTQITYPSGTYASATPTKCFVYDSATVNGNAMAAMLWQMLQPGWRSPTLPVQPVAPARRL
jgi:YD repeat-containing protein